VRSIAATLHPKELGIRHPHRDDVRSSDHMFHSLGGAFRAAYTASVLIADYRESKPCKVGAAPISD